jgi:hypothetical protein
MYQGLCKQQVVWRRCGIGDTSSLQTACFIMHVSHCMPSASVGWCISGVKLGILAVGHANGKAGRDRSRSLYGCCLHACTQACTDTTSKQSEHVFWGLSAGVHAQA